MISGEKLQELLNLKEETPKVEFKLKYVLTGQNNSKIKDEVAKDILALTNTGGRAADDFVYLIIGAGDQLRTDGTREYEDVRPYAFSSEQFLSLVNARCTPGIPNLVYAEVELNGNFYGVIEIPPSPLIHELNRTLDTTKGSWHKGSVLIRRGAEVGIASYSENKAIEREKEKWSGTPAVLDKTPLEKLEEYISDNKIIPLNRLIANETKNYFKTINTEEFLRKDTPLDLTDLNERITEYDQILKELVEFYVFGCFHDQKIQTPVWSEGLSIIGENTENFVNRDCYRRLRRYPALLIFYAAGTAAVAAGNYKILASLFNQTRIRRWGRFESVAFALAPSTVVDPYDRHVLKEFKIERMPLELHLQNYLRPYLLECVHSEDKYLDSFTRFEYLFALFSLEQDRGLIKGSYMWGTEVRRKQHIYRNGRIPIISETIEEIDKSGSDWLPFKEGLYETKNWDEFLAKKVAFDQKMIKCVEDHWDY